MNDDGVWARPVVAATPAQAWRMAVDELRRKPGSEAMNLVVRVNIPSETLPDELADERATILSKVDELLGLEPTTLAFTHGRRIRAWGSDRLSSPISKDQLSDYVIPVLRAKAGSRRAIVTLSDPEVDQTAASRERSIIAPQLIQFHVRNGCVHVTAYYRAQDIYRFWPVNFIELCRLQQHVADEIGAARGAITTISHIAYLNAAAFTEASTTFVLPIETSEFARLNDHDLRELISKIASDDQLALSELARLVRSDFDREHYRALSPRHYAIVKDEIGSHPELEPARAPSERLSAAVAGLVTGAARDITSERNAELLVARGIADAMLFHLGLETEPRPVILAVEGWHSDGKWLDDLEQVVDSEFPEAIYSKKRFRISNSHVFLGRTDELQQDFRHYYNTAVQTHKSPYPPVTVVAHSYGSLVVALAARRFSELRFTRVVFAGSVVKANWDWSRPVFDHLLNEVGSADWVLSLARVAAWMGDAGRRGFRPTGPISGKLTNLTNRYGQHSDFLDPLHMQRVWIPFLRYGRIMPPPALQMENLDLAVSDKPSHDAS